MPRVSTVANPTTAEEQEEIMFRGIEQYELQKTIVTKLAKGALPSNVKLQKDVVSAISKSSSVFINYIAATAHESSQKRGVKTISASDVLKGIHMADFYPDELLPLLEQELEQFRAQQVEAKAAQNEQRREERRRTKESAAADGGAGGEGGAMDVDSDLSDLEGRPAPGGGVDGGEEEVQDDGDDDDEE